MEEQDLVTEEKFKTFTEGFKALVQVGKGVKDLKPLFNGLCALFEGKLELYRKTIKGPAKTGRNYA